VTSALFQDITQHGVVIPYQHFGTACQSYLQRSRSPRRRLVTFGYSVYIGKGVGSDWLTVGCQPRGLMQCEGDGSEERTLVAQCCCEVKCPGKMKPLPSAGR